MGWRFRTISGHGWPRLSVPGMGSTCGRKCKSMPATPAIVATSSAPSQQKNEPRFSMTQTTTPIGKGLTFQDLILTLQNYWASQGCVVVQPYDMEMGAGTFHT